MIGTTQSEISCVPAALLQQVMQLTPEQIAGLPQDQQAQVLALQQHMVRSCFFLSQADYASRWLLPCLAVLCPDLLASTPSPPPLSAPAINALVAQAHS